MAIARTTIRAAWVSLALFACVGTERTVPSDNTAAANSTPPPVLDSGVHRSNVVVSPGGVVPATAQVPATSQADTARGIVRRIGPDPVSRLALFPVGADNGAPLALTGAQQIELAAAEGLEVMVSGAKTTERAMEVSPGGAVVFRVRRFAVRAAEGVEAHDGVLVKAGERVYLEIAPGKRVPVVNLPAALNAKIGARVFLVGPLTRAPQAFGVLAEK